MSSLQRWFLIAIGGVVLVGILAAAPVLAQGPGGMMGGGMMGYTQGVTGTHQFGPGGMMGNFFNGDGDFTGMMGGMMTNPNNVFYTAPTPLTMDEVSAVLKDYLASLNDSNLDYRDIMLFDNHAYAQIIGKDSGVGVLEVLVDYKSKTVYPEMGPNMMWNQQYGMMGGGMMGGMMRKFGLGGQKANPTAELPVTPAQAIEAAQSFLDTNFAGAKLTTATEAKHMAGYYTIDIDRDGQPAGMLSVNGYTGAVWPHTWHGHLLQESDDME